MESETRHCPPRPSRRDQRLLTLRGSSDDATVPKYPSSSSVGTCGVHCSESLPTHGSAPRTRPNRADGRDTHLPPTVRSRPGLVRESRVTAVNVHAHFNGPSDMHGKTTAGLVSPAGGVLPSPVCWGCRTSRCRGNSPRMMMTRGRDPSASCQSARGRYHNRCNDGSVLRPSPAAGVAFIRDASPFCFLGVLISSSFLHTVHVQHRPIWRVPTLRGRMWRTIAVAYRRRR
jgi:hypothetical protein